MIATIVNVVLVLLGSILGLVFKNRISSRFSATLTSALGLCVMGIGVTSMIGTNDTLCVIVCMVAGTLLGEALRIEDRLEGIGDVLRRRLLRQGGSSRFVEGFVNATVLFCVGAMAINGSMQAGMLGKYDILISKGVIDGVTAITFAAAMGVGVAFSAIPLLLYQGGLTLIFSGGPGHRPPRHRDVRRGGHHHRGHRPEHAGPAQGENPGGQYAPGHLPASGLPPSGRMAGRAGRLTAQKRV